MNTVLSLSPESQQSPPQLGDILHIVVFTDEKLGAPGDTWRIEAPAGATWLPAGSLTLAVDSAKSLPVEGSATKIEISGLAHQPGPLELGPFTLRNENTKQVIQVETTKISGTEVAGASPQTAPGSQAQAKEELPWLLPPVAFGGWNWPLLVFLALALLGGLGFGLRKLIQKFPGHLRRKLSHTELALNGIANLQRYGKSKKGLQQEEWKKFSFELADVLRKYSDANWNIDSSDMTDRELLAELRTHATASPHLGQLEQILTTITEVRYGRKELEPSFVPSLLLEARRFVENTTAKPAEGNVS
jgi:hypothetical protein